MRESELAEKREIVQAKFESLVQRAVDHELSYAAIRAYPAGLPAPDHRSWPDRSPAAIRAYEQGNDRLLVELLAIDPTELHSGWAAYDILKEQLESEVQLRVCRRELWDVSHMDGWHLTLVQVARDQPVETPDHLAQALERWQSTPHAVQEEIENLRRGLAGGYCAPKSVVQRVIQQIAGLADAPAGRSPLLSPAERSVEEGFKSSFAAVIEDKVKPALRRYGDYLEREYVHQARESLAIADLPDGARCYQAYLRTHTTLQRSAQEVYDLGARTVNANAARVADLGSRHLGVSDLRGILRRIDEAPDNRFSSKEELIAFSREVVARARELCGSVFASLPAQTVLVEPFREFMLGSGASSHYELQTDLAQPAYYRIATDHWEDVRRSAAELTAVHEAYPGHHLQIALTHALEQSPVAKFSFNAAYLEGWARYAERFAEEIGIYTNPYVSMTSRSWPARGMVADPGLHVLGWSREQTVAYIMESGNFTTSTANDLVDRMAILPGQLTAYDSGGLEFMALREQAQRQLGTRFELREFHRVVLEQGVVPLPTLRRQVERWIAQRSAA